MTHTYNLTAIAESIHKQIQKTNYNISFDQIQSAAEASFDGLYGYARIKKANGVFHTRLKALGVGVARTVLLDMVAMSLGHRNHHSLKSITNEFSIVSDKWYSLKIGQITVIVGRVGTGKSVLVASESHKFDSPDALVIDYGDSYSARTIQSFNKEHNTKYTGFNSAEYVNMQLGDLFPIKAGFNRIIIDEAYTVIEQHGNRLMQLFALNPTAHIIILVQDEMDMHRFGLNPDKAEKVYGNLGTRAGYEDWVKAYLFKPKSDGSSQKDIRKKEIQKFLRMRGKCIALIGGIGSGKTHVIAEALHLIDSPKTLIIDDGNFSHISRAFLPKSKIWANPTPTNRIPTFMMLQNELLIVDNAYEAANKSTQIEDAIDFAHDGTIVLFLRNEEELKSFALDASKAEISAENIGPSDRKEQQVNGYVFDAVPKQNSLYSPRDFIEEYISHDYRNDAYSVFKSTGSIESALRAGVLAEYLVMDPSIIAKSSNFEGAYALFNDSTDRSDSLVLENVRQMLLSGLTE